jgi:hypothetical protein
LKSLLTFAVALALGGAGAADEIPEPEWVLVRETDGLTVSRRDGGPGELPAIRATASVDASILEILAVLRDDDRRSEWLARCVDARLLERSDRWHSINYSRMSAWPFQDRDVVVETHSSIGTRGETAMVRMQSIESPLAEPVDGVVRMPRMVGHYRLQAEGNGRTLVEYQMAIDLGGRVSRRIARLANEDLPLETLRNLRAHLPAVRESYAELVAGWAAEMPASSARPRQLDDISKQSD